MKRKCWFEKIDATSTLPNLYPYSEDSTDSTRLDETSEGVLKLHDHSDNVVTLNSWAQDDQLAV